MSPIIKSTFLSICMLFSATALSFAHSVVSKSDPENGSHLSTAPERIEVSFSKPTRIIKASISHDEKGQEKLVLSTKEPTTKISFTPTPKDAGKYVVKWRALSQDGHVLKGSLEFSIGEPK